MAADAETLQLLDDQLAAAIAVMPAAAVLHPGDGSATIIFDVSSADAETAQVFQVTNYLLEIKRLVQARIASFAGRFNETTLQGQRLTVEGTDYRIALVTKGNDQVSYHLALESLKK